MKTRKLKDAGKAPFRVGPLAMWIGFGAVDDAGREVEVRVQDSALQRLDLSSTGADHTHVLVKHRDELFKIAEQKYANSLVETGGIISITEADVAQAGLLRG
jgi:hypothetical protein